MFIHCTFVIIIIIIITEYYLIAIQLEKTARALYRSYSR